MERISLGPGTKRVINAICFVLSLCLLIYNISIIGFFYLMIAYGEQTGIIIYSLISVTGILLVIVPLVFGMAKYKYYHYALIGTHLIAVLLPFFMRNLSGIFGRLL